MKKRILTGITTTGVPHIGNYLGAIKPALDIANDNNDNDSFFFLADLHSIIKQTNPEAIQKSVKEVALAWLSCGLDPDTSYFYRQSDISEIAELSWILGCVTAKGLINRSHAYKASVDENKNNNQDQDKAISMGLFSYPVLMAADILIFNSTHVPVGQDQAQHLEMTRDIAARFNHIYSDIFNLPEAIISKDTDIIPGVDGRKMSKSYNNTIPFLCKENKLKKAISKIVTNSLEPGEPKEYSSCNLYKIYSVFSSESDIEEMKKMYSDGIGWGDAKEKVFQKINLELAPIRDQYFDLLEKPDYINDVLNAGAKSVKPMAKELLDKVKEATGISLIK
tara:strand:- start:9485 stop:10492 length:1008 start_codon:yes stop_codon:yes gene_type:complete